MYASVIKVTVTEDNRAQRTLCCPNKATLDDNMRHALLMWDRNSVHWYGKRAAR